MVGVNGKVDAFQDMLEMSHCEMCVKKFTIKGALVFLGSIQFHAEETKDVWSAINDLVKNAIHDSVAGTCREEKSGIGSWET